VLNLGHTFGHAIEHAAGHGTVPHGVAVAVGIALALETSRALGLLEDRELPARVARLLARLGLPSTLAELRQRTSLALDGDALLAAMRLDKKSRDAQPRLVLPRAIGSIAIDVPVERERLVECLR
jgi:3-dehydroquinate synthase